MANLGIAEYSKAVKGRTGKSAPKVDLTAMVDLMFLLTTFFMLTTTLDELKAADVAKPNPGDVKAPYPASRTMTILIGKNRQVAWYMGEPEKAVIKSCKLSQIGDKLLENKLAVAAAHAEKPGNELVVIIKPVKTATYKDFVDVIDEMRIAAIKSYAIDDEFILKKEKEFMSARGI